MRRNACLLQELHHEVGHTVVDGALPLDRTLFDPVERRGVILVRNQQNIRLIGFKYFLGLSFVELFSLYHFLSPWLDISNPPFGGF